MSLRTSEPPNLRTSKPPNRSLFLNARKLDGLEKKIDQGVHPVQIRHRRIYFWCQNSGRFFSKTSNFKAVMTRSRFQLLNLG